MAKTPTKIESYLSDLIRRKFNLFITRETTDDSYCSVTELGDGRFRTSDNVICYLINYKDYVSEYNEKKGEDKSLNLTEKSSKSFQFKIIKDLIKSSDYDYALVAFYDNESLSCRLSLVRKIYPGEGKVEFTKYNRQTHFFQMEENDEGELVVKNNKTFEKYVANRNASGEYKKWLKVEDLLDAFSIEKVSDEFYKKVAYWYFWAYEKIEEVNGFPKDCVTDSQRFEFMTSMITRIMFIWFLKEIDLVNPKLFDYDKIKDIIKVDNNLPGTYYKAILQNLFFATLSTPIDKRKFRDNKGNKKYNTKLNGRGDQSIYRYQKYFNPGYDDEIFVKSLFEKTPFFNGGLFECKDIRDEGSSKKIITCLDGFSDNDGFDNYCLPTKINETNLNVPNELFFGEEHKTKRLNEYFNIDKKGKRKSKDKDYSISGLFEILSQYNFTIDENSATDQDISIDPELLGKVFENLLGAQNPETKVKARNESGSFYTPREIVDYMCNESLKEYLKTNISCLCDKDLDKLFNDENYDAQNPFDEETSKNIINAIYNVKILDPACGSGAFPMGMLLLMVNLLDKLGDIKTHYERKKCIIKNCLYGVDIQQMAQEISFLRFFLSLLVDQDIDYKNINKNYGVEPLPNLDFKIMQGNSLVERVYKGVDINRNLFMDKIKYQRLTNQFINENNRDKKRAIKDDIYDILYYALTCGTNDNPELKEKIEGKKDKDFFFYDIYFSEVFENGGFDIVIGNPPYIQLQTMDKDLKALYKNQKFAVHTDESDIYCLFYEKGINLLREHGNLCYITSNKWMRAGYGKKLRGYFCDFNPLVLIDLGPKVFKSATVDTNILLIKKLKLGKYNLEACSVKVGKGQNPKDHLGEFVKNNSVILKKLSSDSWFIGDDAEFKLMDKIEKKGSPLKDWDVTINYGIKTGFNDAFIIDTATKDKILNNCSSTDERQRTEKIIKPILRGSDIKRYEYIWADQWVIGTFPALNLNIKDYPAIEKYFLDNFDKIRLEQTGKDYGSFKARKRTCNDWFETQDQIGYHQDFEKEKIVWGNISISGAFTYVEPGVYVNAPANFLTTNKDFKYLYGNLNSKIFTYLFQKVGIFLGNAYEWKRSYVEQVYIPNITDDNRHLANQIEDLVDKIIAEKKKGKDTTDLEDQIDNLVYQLYDLTDDEIKIIEKY